MSSSWTFPKMRVTFVLSSGFLKIARASWYILWICYEIRIVGATLTKGQGVLLTA